MDGPIKVEVRSGCEVIAEHRASPHQTLLVGRSKGADICLEGSEISRHHALLIPREDGVVVRDRSRNGLTCGGLRVQDGALLPYGTSVQAGRFTLVLGEQAADGQGAVLALKQQILEQLVEQMDADALSRSPEELRARVEAALERLAHRAGVPPGAAAGEFVKALADEAVGLGPLEPLLADQTVSEIMVIDRNAIFVERNGQIERTGLGFTSDKALQTAIERIIAPLGRRLDESSPMVDARLADGCRVNVVIPPLAIRGACITIRKFPGKALGIEDLLSLGSLTRPMADLLTKAVRARANIVISGGTGSGKTTLLGVLSGAIPDSERIVTVEDAAELRLAKAHLVSLESRPPNAEGQGQVTIRDLVRNALRMRPDRIIVGECRGGEAIDMLQAMNTGHDGSLTTVHANAPAEAVARLETLCLMAGLDLPSRAIREQIARAIDLIVQQARLPDGSRRVVSISEIDGIRRDGTVALHELFRFVRPGQDEGPGRFEATGRLPHCVGEAGVDLDSAPAVAS